MGRLSTRLFLKTLQRVGASRPDLKVQVRVGLGLVTVRVIHPGHSDTGVAESTEDNEDYCLSTEKMLQKFPSALSWWVILSTALRKCDF